MTAIAPIKQLPIPGHFDPKGVAEVRRVPYQQLASQAREWSKKHNIRPAAADRKKIGLLIVDAQNTFCIPGFELFVAGRSLNGAVEDNTRLCQFVYRNMGVITQIAPTMDTHTGTQIFHEQFFVNDAGEHPTPMTEISIQDVLNGKWKVNPAIGFTLGVSYASLVKYVQHYAQQLEKANRYKLKIWPYHAMLGGIGHALVASVEEALFFHNIARSSQTNIQIKGGNPLSENYSILRPEILTGPANEPIGQKNTVFYRQLLGFDYLIIAGQAKSHCVAWTIADLLTEINAQDPDLAKKVYLLEDCTSAVFVPKSVTGLSFDIDYTDEADKAFADFAAAGMNIVKSTDPIENWPGVDL